MRHKPLTNTISLVLDYKATTVQEFLEEVVAERVESVTEVWLNDLQIAVFTTQGLIHIERPVLPIALQPRCIYANKPSYSRIEYFIHLN